MGQGGVSNQTVNVKLEFLDGFSSGALDKEAVSEDGAPKVEGASLELKGALFELGEAREHQVTQRRMKRFNVPKATAVGTFIDLVVLELQDARA